MKTMPKKKTVVSTKLDNSVYSLKWYLTKWNVYKDSTICYTKSLKIPNG